MRNPLRKAGYWLVLGLVGGGVTLAAVYNTHRIGDLPGVIVASVGITCVAVGLVCIPISLLAAIGHARLLSGHGVIARWHLTPEEWDRFRAFDAIRAAQGPTLANDLSIRKHTPEDGVDVIVGRKQLIVDGSYHVLRRYGLPELMAVWWLPAPADPECLEFTIAYPRGRHGGTMQLSLRVPVAPSAREAGVRVFEHFRTLAPERGPGLAHRRPGLVIGWGLALLLACLTAAGVGWLLDMSGVAGMLPPILMIFGLIGGGGALSFTVLIVLVTRPWKRERPDRRS